MKKSYFCEKLEKTLHFLPNKIQYCCSCTIGANYEIENFSQISKKDITKKREEYIELLNEGIIPKGCVGCVEYKEKEYKKQNSFQKFFNKKNKISHIILDHYKQCDCTCIYCSQKILYPQTMQNYDVLPIIKQLYKQNMISQKHLTVEFQGGNISCLKEFEALIEEFNKKKNIHFIFLTNGIKHLPILETLPNSENHHICISLDAGTKATFKKIKNVDAFENVIQNIKTINEKTKMSIGLKYIIIKGINDNAEELNKFLNLSKEIKNVSPIYLEIDYNNTILNGDTEFKVPAHYYELFDITENFCKENNLNYIFFPHTKRILENGRS